jgi:hypothetical protein
LKGLDIIILLHAGVIHEERGLDCLFCCGSLLQELVIRGQFQRGAPNETWKHVPVTLTDQPARDDAIESIETLADRASSKSPKAARRRKKKKRSGIAASDVTTIEHSTSDTGYSERATQTNPASLSLPSIQWSSSSIMNPATVFNFTPTSVPDGIDASTQTKTPPSEFDQALTAEYIQNNDEIVKQATKIAKRYRDLEMKRKTLWNHGDAIKA